MSIITGVTTSPSMDAIPEGNTYGRVNQSVVEETPLSPNMELLTQVNEEPAVYTSIMEHFESRPQSNNEFDGIPERHDNWKFNKLLLDLTEAISPQELTKLKSMYRGEIGEGVLEKIQNACDLFKILRQRSLINRDNLLLLQSLLKLINRRDLLIKTIEYAKSLGNVVHFYQAPEHPANGYRLVKFHVSTGNRVYSTEYRNQLRHAVSELLFIEERDVIIVGVMPSSSFFMTLMIPEMYAETLQEFLNNHQDLRILVDLNIDTIEISGTTYSVSKQDAKFKLLDDENQQQTMFEDVYKQLRDRTKQLETAERKCLELSRKLDTYNYKEMAKLSYQSQRSVEVGMQSENKSVDAHNESIEYTCTSSEVDLRDKSSNKLEENTDRVVLVCQVRDGAPLSKIRCVRRSISQ